MSHEKSETGEERYELRGRAEVLAVFSKLLKGPIPVITTIAQLEVSPTSRLIDVNPAFEELVFDATGLVGLERLDGSAGLVGSAQIDAIWYRFEAENAVAVRGYAQPAFRARIPAILMRMQRRDSIRYPVPSLNPPVCDVLLNGVALRLRTIDISLSGVGLVLEHTGAKYASGSTWENCLLQIPEIGAIQADLVLVYVAPYGKDGGRRAGCRFSNIRATSLSHLQRYISRLERESLANETRIEAAASAKK